MTTRPSPNTAPATPPVGRSGSPRALARLIDHTVLAPAAGPFAIDRACDEAMAHGLFAVCVAPRFVAQAARRLAASEVIVASVVGFPHGNTLPTVKAYEAECVVAAGAAELDMVIDLGALQAGDDCLVVEDIRAVVERAGEHIGVKVILETALLSDPDKARACRLAADAGATFVKTSTGFTGGGATPADVALMRRTVGPQLGVKASGGIRTLAQARALLEAGANRLGCSRSLAILAAARRESDEP